MDKIYDNSSNRIRIVYLTIFAFSGLAGLIYESIWTSYLKLFLGHAAYAQTLVLAIFMGGMAIGSWLCSNYSRRWSRLLLVYAATEGVLGLCAIFFHPAFSAMTRFCYEILFPSLGNPATIIVFKYALSAMMILPQSILLGMTFPLMSSGMLRLYPVGPGRIIALLYFANSIGAAVGVLLSGFLLIRVIGLPGTIVTAGAINVVIAGVVWLLARKADPGERVDDETVPFATAGDATWCWQLLAVSFLTGAASFIYEIGWIRMLNMVLGTTAQTFELMIFAFISGLALGGLKIQRNIDRLENPVRFLAYVQVAMGLLALATLPLYGHTFELMQWFVTHIPRTDSGYLIFTVASSAIAVIIMVPATFCAGMTLPLITTILLKHGNGERSVGAVYATNTVGAIFGVIFATHLGMPWIGLKGLITSGAALDITVGLALLLSVAAAVTRRRRLVAGLLSVGAILSTLIFVRLDPYKMASAVYRQGFLLNRNDGHLVYQKDGKTATVSCLKEESGHLTIKTNGKTDASIMMNPKYAASDDEHTNILAAVIPMTLLPQIRTAAVIGLGSGLTSQTLLANPRIMEVDTVEIEKAVIEGAKSFRPRVDLVYADPRSRIFNDDAKTYFSTYGKKYDLIFSEPSNTWVSGVAGLFSEEFYRLVKRHMTDKGLFVQWMHLTETNIEQVASVLKAVNNNFSDYAIYAATDLDLLIVAKKDGRLSAPDYSVMAIPSIADSLQRIQVNSVQDIEIRFIGLKQHFQKLIDTFAISSNSDYYPVLEQNALKNLFLKSAAQELTQFVYTPLPVKDLLGWHIPGKGATGITPANSFTNSQLAFVAMGLRDFMMTGKPLDSSVPRDQAESAMKLDQICRGKVVKDENERLGTLLNQMLLIIPYLTPSELEPFFRIVDSRNCSVQFTNREKAWHNLFRANAERDARWMLVRARVLLETETNIPPQAWKYLLASGMLGAVAQNDRLESSRLWSQYKALAFGDKEPDLLFRLLAAESVIR